MIDDGKQSTYQEFLGMMAKHGATPPPRHFGQRLIDQFTNLTVAKRSGLFAARIHVESPERKFWINGLIIKMIIKSKSIYLIYYDQNGQHRLDIELEHLDEMEEYKLRGSTIFAIENEVLVVKDVNLNYLQEEERRDPAIIASPIQMPNEPTRATSLL